MKPYVVNSMITVNCNGIYKVFPFNITVMADSKEEAMEKYDKEVRYSHDVTGASEL